MTTTLKTQSPGATIREGDLVRSRQGRVYEVDEVCIPSSGGHYKAGRTYGVFDVLTGLPNAFRGNEVTKMSQREVQAL